MDENIEVESVKDAPLDLKVSRAGEIAACCEKSIVQHAHLNPIIVCVGCKKLIKCFTEKVAFENYVKFCSSRGRQVITGLKKGYHIVIFKSFDPLG